MASELDEVVAFLTSPSPQVRKAALGIIQGLTGTEEGLDSLKSRADMLVHPLLNLLQGEQAIAQLAAESLVNLSSESSLADAIVKAGAIEHVMQSLGRQDHRMNRLLVMLLVNLTQLESGAINLIKEGEKLEGLHVQKLVRLFSGSSEGNEEATDQYEHVASILVNITRLGAGRNLILDTKKGLLKQILSQIDSGSITRRKGVVGMVRNCCFEAGTQLPSLLSASHYLWPGLLLPLAGKHSYNKDDTSRMPLELASPLSHEREPEPDPQVRIEAAEALYLIVMHESGRKAFWAVNGPRILQIGYEDEENPHVMEACERLGSLLIEEGGMHSDNK